jgi:hypothetical protein
MSPANPVHFHYSSTRCSSCGKRRRDHTLTLDGYRESGGVKGAIAKTAEEIFKNFSPDEQGNRPSDHAALTKLGEGTEDIATQRED